MVLALPQIRPQLAELQSREGRARVGPPVPEQVDGGEEALVEYLFMGEDCPERRATRSWRKTGLGRRQFEGKSFIDAVWRRVRVLPIL
jgi:hypothetical protein